MIVSISILPPKTYRTGRAGDLGAGIAHKSFIQKSSLHGFPDSSRSRDRSVGPLPNLPCALPVRTSPNLGRFS
jgi:hypothetical protein